MAMRGSDRPPRPRSSERSATAPIPSRSAGLDQHRGQHVSFGSAGNERRLPTWPPASARPTRSMSGSCTRSSRIPVATRGPAEPDQRHPHEGTRRLALALAASGLARRPPGKFDRWRIRKLQGEFGLAVGLGYVATNRLRFNASYRKCRSREASAARWRIDYMMIVGATGGWRATSDQARSLQCFDRPPSREPDTSACGIDISRRAFACQQQPAHAPPQQFQQSAEWAKLPKMILERQFAGPLQDTVIQRLRDPVDGTICYLYLPISAPHSPTTATGFVQYGPNTIGSINCGPGPAAAPAPAARKKRLGAIAPVNGPETALQADAEIERQRRHHVEMRLAAAGDADRLDRQAHAALRCCRVCSERHIARHHGARSICRTPLQAKACCRRCRRSVDHHA